VFFLLLASFSIWNSWVWSSWAQRKTPKPTNKISNYPRGCNKNFIQWVFLIAFYD
jgi:hypothetical protein